jgi:hypothetical protein
MLALRDARQIGWLLITSFIIHLGGVLLFNGHFLFGWFVETPTWLAWERGAFIAAYATAGLGIAVLGSALRSTPRGVLGRLAATGFVIAALLAIFVEISFIIRGGAETALITVMVVALLVAEATIGWSLISSGVLADWVGWAVLVWNVGWLAVLLSITADDPYFPILHFLPLLLIGVRILSRETRSSRSTLTGPSL